jgi:hypothetical protein
MATEQSRDTAGLLISTIIILGVIGGLICAVTYSDGYEEGIRYVRYEAVKAGAAEWSFDESGRPAFQWKASE